MLEVAFAGSRYLMRKLGVRSTATLLVRAMRDGLIDLSDVE